MDFVDVEKYWKEFQDFLDKDNKLIAGTCNKNYRLFKVKIEPIEKMLTACDSFY